MTKFGEKLIAAAREALSIARGETAPAAWHARCDVCGKFVKFGGHRVLLTPDSHFSREEYETLCDLHRTIPTP